MAPNVRAIKEWVKVNRPDIRQDVLDATLSNDAIILIASMAFAAGCEFHAMNPGVGKFLTESEESYIYDFKR